MRRMLFATLLLTACGASAGTHVVAPAGVFVAREGATSGSMSRIDESETPLDSQSAYPTGPTTATGVPPATEIRSIHLGETVRGQLRRVGSPGSPIAIDYVFAAPAGATILADMRGHERLGEAGSHIDSYLYLLRDGREVTHDDDGGGNLDSHIEARLTEGGLYTLRATTFGGGQTEGDFELTLH